MGSGESSVLQAVEQATLCGGGCDVPLYDGFTLCPKHTARLRSLLGQVPDVWANLQVTIRRQDATGGSGGGQTGSKPCINVHAHDIGETLTDLLSGWAGCLAQDYRRRTPTDATRLLLGRLDDVTHEPWAGDLTNELTKAMSEARNATDRAADRIDLGVCSDTCEHRITAIVGSAHTTCRHCGTIWSVHERQLNAIDAAWHAGAPMPVILRALKDHGITVKPKDAENWVLRGKLVACVWGDGTKHYQVAAVRSLHTVMMAKRTPKYPANGLLEPALRV